MKTIYFAALVFSLFKSSFSQNLVPNPGFENFSSCPIGPDELYKASSWTSYGASPDYMNVCNSFSMGVPLNWGGYQQASGGVAYGACATYDSLSPNYREYLGATLTTPLTMGVKYYASFQTNLSMGGLLDANYATNKIGLRFSNQISAGITNNSHVFSSTVISDTMGWTKVFGTFVADSSYTRVILGNFFDDSSTTKIEILPGSTDVAYYYLDDVCVSTDSLYSLLYTSQPKLPVGDGSCLVFPNPFRRQLNISFPSAKYDIVIYDIIGNVLFEEKELSNDTELDLVDIPSGLIFLEIFSCNTLKHYKLLKL